jgi:opacity protein-like surface antigen
MKTALKNSLKLACLAAALCAACAGAARAQQPAAGLTPERVRMDQLDRLSARAEKFVDVSVDENLLRLPVSLFANSKDPKAKEVAEIVAGLKGVYVRVFEFAAAGQYSESDFSGIREQVSGAGWSRLVNVVNKRDDRHVEVFLQTGPGSIGGLVVIATEPKSLAVVNILGKIDVERLSKLEGKFGIPDLADLTSGGDDDDDDNKPKPATKKP